jgi:hypothetical protein
MRINDRKNCQRLIGLRTARLLINTRIIPVTMGIQPRFFMLLGKNINIITPIVSASTDLSAAIPLYQ